MPCHNAGQFVESAISSAFQQSYINIELIVVDDGSSDDSRTIIESISTKYPHQFKYLFQEQCGPYPARNHGLRLASGQYIAFLDADDWWESKFLEELLSAIIENDADLAYCGWQNVGEHTVNSEPFIPPAYKDKEQVFEFLRSCPWPIHAALAKRSIIDAVEGFSERRFSSMDYDLWLRIFGHTQNFVRVPKVLAYYRWHGSGQISANKWKQVLDAVQVRRDFIAQFPNLVDGLTHDSLRELVEGQLLREAYRAYWKRDLLNAQKLFREAFSSGVWLMKDLKFLIPALMPYYVFKFLVKMADTTRGKK